MIRRPPRSTLFPSRRSSDLALGGAEEAVAVGVVGVGRALPHAANVEVLRVRRRSEEHTSELQSRRDLVCRLLLEKKKKKDTRSGAVYYTLDNSRKLCSHGRD